MPPLRTLRILTPIRNQTIHPMRPCSDDAPLLYVAFVVGVVTLFGGILPMLWSLL